MGAVGWLVRKGVACVFVGITIHNLYNKHCSIFSGFPDRPEHQSSVRSLSRELYSIFGSRLNWFKIIGCEKALQILVDLFDDD